MIRNGPAASRVRGAMRLSATVLSLALGCTGAVAPAASPERAATPPGPSARAGPAATRDCVVDWVRHYRTLAELAQDARLVVRATAVRQDVVQLKAFGGAGDVSRRDARRTTLRVTSVLRATVPAPAEVRVLEDACPNLEAGPDEEWVLFLRRWDPRYGPDDPGDHWISAGGPQGQFRIRAGAVSGPYFVFADAVNAYQGTSVDRLVADVAALPR